MSNTSITHLFPFCRVKITGQSVFKNSLQTVIDVQSDLRYTPICWICRNKVWEQHSWIQKQVRDLNLFQYRVYLNCSYRKVFCPACGIRVEELGFVEPYVRVSKRLARCVFDLCKRMSIKDVAEHFGLDWKTVKEIDKHFLEQEFGETDYQGLKILAIDEIAVRKGHNYMTVVLDYISGRVVWMREGRKEETLDEFFKGMTPQQREGIEAVAIDMWKPYINAVQKWCPQARIVFDFFHVVKEFNKTIDKIRNEEYRKADEAGKEVLKGAKFILLKNDKNLQSDEKGHLQDILKLNQMLSTVYILKDYLKKIWDYRYRAWAQKALDHWCELARESGNQDLISFGNKLQRHSWGILNHCNSPISTGKLEGTNNKIKVIHRQAYGFHDLHYFTLKVKQAFPGFT